MSIGTRPNASVVLATHPHFFKMRVLKMRTTTLQSLPRARIRPSLALRPQKKNLGLGVTGHHDKFRKPKRLKSCSTRTRNQCGEK